MSKTPTIVKVTEPVTLGQIITTAEGYNKSYEGLEKIILDESREMEAIRAKYRGRIHEVVGQLCQSEELLTRQIEANPHHFKKPRTIIVGRIKIGMEKGSGSVTFTDAKRTVELIEKHYSADEAATLLHIEKTPDKDALAKLPAAELKKLAVEIVDTGDFVVVRPQKSETSKLVAAAIKAAREAQPAEVKKAA